MKKEEQINDFNDMSDTIHVDEDRTESLIKNHEYICPSCGTLHKREAADAASYTLEHKRKDRPSFLYQVLVCKRCAKKLKSYEIYSRYFGGILGVIFVVAAIIWFVFFASGGAVPVLGFIALGFFAYWFVRKLLWHILFGKKRFSIESAKQNNALYNWEL